MKRKEFIGKSYKCGMASIIGLIVVPSGSKAKEMNDTNQEEIEKIKNDIDFAQQRFSELLKHLENCLDKETRLKLYTDLGESCANTYVDQLTPLKGNLKMLLDEQLKQDWLKKYELDESIGTLKLIGKPKNKCGCPLVQNGLTSKEFCNCSLGHIKKVYKEVTGKKIKVTLDESILMGNKQCSFTVSFLNS